MVIWPNDHRPPHVHVIGNDREAVFELGCPVGPPRLRQSFGFRLAEIRSIEKALVAMTADLCVQWSAIHGDQ